jgi:hypothetical protein
MNANGLKASSKNYQEFLDVSISALYYYVNGNMPRDMFVRLGMNV